METITDQVDDHTSLSYKRRTLAELTGRWLGDRPATVIRAAYASYQATGVPNLGTVNGILGF